MGNMGQQHQHLGNATSVASLLHQISDMWKSPRGTVLRIEALALVAIFLSFFLAAFESCRRWSNNFLFQKGFLVANAVFLSLGTYSIGLMQSSPVKSEMYPIWAVSLLALLCCVDSAAASGLDNRSQLWKLLYQLCLYFGYVLLMSITTMSMDTAGNIAICVLAAMTFIKGFHRSMALVLPSSLRNMIREIPADSQKCSFGVGDDADNDLQVHRKLDIMIGHRHRAVITMYDIAEGAAASSNMRRVCLSFSLSHLLHRRFLGLRRIDEPAATDSTSRRLVRDSERAMDVVEVELAFLYDVLYTSNAFLHYYEARGASIWAIASALGIASVGVAAVILPAGVVRTSGGRTPPTAAAGSGTILVDTTVLDLAITGVILVSLALLQLLQLVRCWTSNWARVAFACDRARGASFGMGLREYLLKFNWFDDKDHLWQNKLGQDSVIDGSSMVSGCLSRYGGGFFCCGFLGSSCPCSCSFWARVSSYCSLVCAFVAFVFWICSWPLMFLVRRCLGLLGLQYIGREVREMFRGTGTGGAAIPLHAHVKTYIGDFVGRIRTHPHNNEVDGWASSSVENGGRLLLPDLLVKVAVPPFDAAEADEMMYVSCILMWHIATCYCELSDDHQRRRSVEVFVDRSKDDHRRVAMDLSRYCAYLVSSAPRLLPGRSETTKQVYAQLKRAATRARKSAAAGDKLLAMDVSCDNDDDVVEIGGFTEVGRCVYKLGVKLGKGLVGKMAAAQRWELLADFWVKALLYAAPSDNVEEHMQHLSQGGELITHLWAMLYHAGIQEKWHLVPPRQRRLKMGWDYIFRTRSWKDLSPRKGKLEKIREVKKTVDEKIRNVRRKGFKISRVLRWGKKHTTGGAQAQPPSSVVTTDAACRDARLDGPSSSSCPALSSPSS